jgi:hypothetical protein
VIPVVVGSSPIVHPISPPVWQQAASSISTIHLHKKR